MIGAGSLVLSTVRDVDDAHPAHTVTTRSQINNRIDPPLFYPSTVRPEGDTQPEAEVQTIDNSDGMRNPGPQVAKVWADVVDEIGEIDHLPGLWLYAVRLDLKDREVEDLEEDHLRELL